MARTTIKSKKKKGELIAASKDASRDVLPSGLGMGSTFVDSASKALASYGKFIVPALTAVVLILGAIYFIGKSQTSGELAFKNRIDRVAMADNLDELKTGMEVIIAEAEDKGSLVGYANYRYAVRAYALLERPYAAQELQDVIGVLEGALDQLGEGGDQASWQRHVAGLHARLKADQDFLSRPEGQAVLPWTHRSKADKPETRLVAPSDEDLAEPVVVLVTSAGTLRIRLYEDDAPNAVYHVLSLFSEGFYDRTSGKAVSFSNSFNPTGLYKGATVVNAGEKGRPVGVELEKPEDEDSAEESDDSSDEDTVPEANPYSIEYQGSPTQPFVAGSFALARDPEDPSRARSEFFIVIEPSPALRLNFAPLGYVLDGEEGLKVARRLHDAEIFYTYVEQKRPGVEYVPSVYYDGWPVAMKKRTEVPEPVRFSALETEILPAGSRLNPIVVFELEGGDIVIELLEDIAPNTVANFINLIEEGFYNSECSFYRILGSAEDIGGIYREDGPRIAQGGFSGSDSREGYEYVIRNEAVDNEAYAAAGIGNIRGSVAMARKTDLDSASTEFFINMKDWDIWDQEDSPYCVFGEVLYGLEIAQRVKQNDEIKSARVVRKRDHKYVPQVRYAEGGGWVEKKPVELPAGADEE